MLKTMLRGALGAVLTIFFGTFLAFAQLDDQKESLRDITANAMFEHAQMLYDRGNFDDTAIVVRNVLQVSPRHAGARAYAMNLTKRGFDFSDVLIKEEPKPVVVAVRKPAPVKEIVVKKVPAKSGTAKKKEELPAVIDTPPVVVASSNDNQDLKVFLQQKEQTMADLRSQIDSLKADIQSLTSGTSS